MATQTKVRPGAGVAVRRSEGVWRDAWKRLRKNRLAIVGMFGVFLLAFAGIFGPLLAPWPYQVQDITAVVANGNEPIPPFQDMSHPLGTDQLCRDLMRDRKSTRLNSSHSQISYAVFCLKKKKKKSR